MHGRECRGYTKTLGRSRQRAATRACLQRIYSRQLTWLKLTDYDPKNVVKIAPIRPTADNARSSSGVI